MHNNTIDQFSQQKLNKEKSRKLVVIDVGKDINSMRWDRRDRKKIEERRLVPGEKKINEGEVLLCAIRITNQDSNW